MTVRDEALALIRKMEVQGAIEDAETATGHLLCCYDPMLDRRTYHGPYTDPVQAARVADDWQRELNSGGGFDQPFEVTVVLLQPPVDQGANR
jgi:hypothetical protein